MKYFVWLPGSRESEAQIWYDLPTDDNGKSHQKPLFQHKLTEHEEDFTLDFLMEKYKDKANG